MRVFTLVTITAVRHYISIRQQIQQNFLTRKLTKILLAGFELMHAVGPTERERNNHDKSIT